MQNVNFLPWIGKNYQNGLGSTGLKVLVLGESHYCFTLGQGKCPGCTLDNCIKAGFTKEDFEQQTIEYIKDILYNNTGLPYQQTPLSFEKAMLGKQQVPQPEREEFWNSLVFYNYLQKSLPKIGSSRTSIKKEDLIGADIALEEILKTFLPDRIIVWGCRLFALLSKSGGVVSELVLPSGEKTEILTFDINGKSIPALKVYHPSYPMGRRWKYWHQFYKEFLK